MILEQGVLLRHGEFRNPETSLQSLHGGVLCEVP